MSYKITDSTLIEEIIALQGTIKQYENTLTASNTVPTFSHPLDDEIIGENGLLNKLILVGDFITYSDYEQMDHLWKQLLKKAIICLRYFDKRESFKSDNTKKIEVYGMDALEDYHRRYTDFESMMYGANAHYRDHVFHVVRVWLLGIFCMLKDMSGNDSTPEGNTYIDTIQLDGGAFFPSDINFFEKISMWTIIALCHDLGYPLEKASQILNKTKNMMKDFVPNPNLWSDFGYRGVQDNINEYILRFISTKMLAVDGKQDTYLGRIQPKYYLKFAKSLESLQHGIVSSVIIFKLLVYFLESDFSLNEDYTFTAEDARQFYIRREILRAIASHTCPDAYNIHINTFSSLLFLCDEMQEWGRKSWNELYTGVAKSTVTLNLHLFGLSGIHFEEQIEIKEIKPNSKSDTKTTKAIDKEAINSVLRIFERQYSLYKSTFRDGSSSLKRDFELQKKITIKLPTRGSSERFIYIAYSLPTNGNSFFSVKLDITNEDMKEGFLDTIKSTLSGKTYSDDIKVERK